MFNLTRGEAVTALIAVALLGLATATVSLLRGDKGKTIEIPLNKSGKLTVQPQGAKSQGNILVHITGEVHRNGVLELSSGSRVKDAIEFARPTENADLESLNLAAFLVDGERIVVPGKGLAAPRNRSSPRAKPARKLNINIASRQQLESIPGIGPVIAGRIIEFRRQGTFHNVDDLLQIRGIGPATLEKVREYVCVK